MGLGKYIHYGIDFLMLSMLLAGVQKTTGLSLNINSLAKADDSRSFLKKYLSFGEHLFDGFCSLCRRSGIFKENKIESYEDLSNAVKNTVNNLISSNHLQGNSSNGFNISSEQLANIQAQVTSAIQPTGAAKKQ
ncbi:unnamed protein product [[Candida] boidinii]|nr:unnamed protein product [[Candida] boidinii]